MKFTAITAAAVLASTIVAHPGHDHSAEIAQRAAFMATSKRDLSHCASKMKARGLERKAIARRSAVLKQARAKRGIAANAPYLKARDAATVLNTTHASNSSYNFATSSDLLFDSNSACILSPEVTQGPYYVSGEYVRENLLDGQQGIGYILDTQVVDIATCDPVTDAMVEIWHVNATGVYSGIVAETNGVGTADPSNINTTFLRGLQPTDDDGVAQFITLLPGHYDGRAPHTHVLAHFNGTLYPNGTYSGGYVSHVGQLFYDQDLIYQSAAVTPYSTNTQDLTLNEDDAIFAEATATGDPVVEYTLLGDDLSAGIFGWISFGIDLTSQETISSAASLYAEGGVSNTNTVTVGGGGSASNDTMSGNGTMGTPPS